MSTIKCPYCWNLVRERELLRHCSDICEKALPDGTRQHATYFPARDSHCPHGGEPPTVRYCNDCKERLEHDYITTPSRVIATIGSTESGKSTYVGVLIREMQNRVGDSFGGMSTELVGDASRERYRTAFANPLYAEGRTVNKTDLAARLDPLLFMTRKRRRRALPLPDRLVAGMNVFYDTAGEAIMNETNLGPLAKYIDAADGILFVLDPLQFSSVRRVVDDNTLVPSAAHNQVQMLQRTAELLRERRGLPATRTITTPLAVVLAKIDTVTDLLPASSVLLHASGHDGAYQEADGRQVHDEVRAVLSTWTDGKQLLNVVDNSFSKYRFFGVSALGDAPVAQGTVSPSGIHPLRVEDPMLWLLAQFGLISTRKART